MNVKHLSQIALGFAIGQGAFFIAQSYIVYENGLALVGQIGIGLGFLSLAQWLSDCGGIFLIPKKLGTSDQNKNLQAFFIARFIVVLTLCFILFASGITNSFTGIAKDIFSWYFAVSIISTFNITGYLDYTNNAKITGPTSGLCWLLPSLSIIFYKELGDDLGHSIGMLFTIGLLLSIIIQFKQSKITSDFKHSRIDIPEIKSNITDIIKYNCIFFTSQCYARTIPLFISNFATISEAGIYIYAKNIANVINQAISFSRRTEFSSLLRLPVTSVTPLILIKKQALSLAIGIVPFIISFFILTLNKLIPLTSNKPLITIVCILLFINIAWIVSSSFSQYLLASSKTGTILAIQTFTILISLSTIFILQKHLGLTAVFIAELLMYSIQTAIYLYALKNLKASYQHDR